MQRSRAVAAAVLGAAGLLAIYLATAFAVFDDAVPLLRHSSGIFDMDVARVTLDLTSGAPAYRPSVHPLQKLLVASLGDAINRLLFDGRERLRAAQVLLAGVVTLHAVGAGLLAFQLARRAAGAGLLAGLLCGVSFSSLLAAAVPESAALASLAAVAPLLLLGARSEKPFTWTEALGWGALAVPCVGLTVTQIAWWAVALGVRARLAGLAAASPAARRAPLARLALGIGVAALLTVGLTELQARLYPGTPAFYRELALEDELHFARFERIRAAPLRHGLSLAAHFTLFDFVAPLPGYSDFLIRDYGFDYWSLSVEEAGLEGFTAPQRVVAAGVLAFVLLAAVFGRWRDLALLAPGLALAGQYALHYVYGREYVLYSPHWHGVLVAVLVAAVWNGLPKRRAWLAGAGALLAAAMLASNLFVLERVSKEVAIGLEVSARDARGAPRQPAALRGRRGSQPARKEARGVRAW